MVAITLLQRTRALFDRRGCPQHAHDFGHSGVLLGGRLGYLLLYDFAAFVANPLLFFESTKVAWRRGGMLGVFLALVWFTRKRYAFWNWVM